LGYELYAFVAEANGQALPMLFMFIETNDGDEVNAKTRALTTCLKAILPFCPNLKFILTDKDASELGAVAEIRRIRPDMKPQLCYWHVLRYIADRLSENKRPGPYDAIGAKQIHDFIADDWVPRRL
jgi:hypothetical protein